MFSFKKVVKKKMTPTPSKYKISSNVVVVVGGGEWAGIGLIFHISLQVPSDTYIFLAGGKHTN